MTIILIRTPLHGLNILNMTLSRQLGATHTFTYSTIPLLRTMATVDFLQNNNNNITDLSEQLISTAVQFVICGVCTQFFQCVAYLVGGGCRIY